MGVFSLCHRVNTGSGSHSGSYPMGTGGSYTGDKVARGMKLTTHFHLAPRLKIIGAVSPLLQYVFMVWCLNSIGFVFMT